MIAGVCAIAGVILSLILIHLASHPPAPPAQPSSSSVVSSPPAPATSNPPAQLVYNFISTGVSSYPCSEESSLHTVGGGSEVSFNFLNRSATYVNIFWLNGNSARIIKDTLYPGDTYSTNSNVQDIWLITAPDSVCEGIFDVDGAGGITITSSS